VYERLGVPWGLSPYYFWGRFAVLIYIAALVGAYALPRGHGRVTRVGRRLLLAGIVLGLVGDALAYWGGTNGLTRLSGIGFGLVESPALLAITAALVVYGIGLKREGVIPHLIVWSLIAGGVLAIPVGFLVITYVPHGILLTILAALALALAGKQTVISRDRRRASADPRWLIDKKWWSGTYTSRSHRARGQRDPGRRPR
jgi:hypothetical protein